VEGGPRRNAQWWLFKPGDGPQPHDAIDQIVNAIRTTQASRYEGYRRYAEAYGANISAFGLSPTFRSHFNDENELRVNELANTIDTLVAQVYKNRIVPASHSVGGTWEERDRAEDLGRWLDGTFDEASVFDDAIPKAGLAAFLFGTGPLRVSHEIVDEKKKLARIVVEYGPTQLCYVDEIEGRFGKPPRFYADYCVDRAYALGIYACEDDDEHLWGTAEERKHIIENAVTQTADTNNYAYAQESDQIVLRLAWSLPSRPGKDDGAFCVTVPGSGTLEKRPYKRRRFPYAFIRHGIPLGDFWGMSLVHRLDPLQKAQDRLDKRIDEAHAMMGVPRIILGKNSGISLDHIDDIPFAILQANDPTQIKEWNAQPVHPDVYGHRDSMAVRMRGIAGVSAYSAQGNIPAGLKNASGKALEAFEDAENARHAMLHRSYEAAIIDLAEIMIDEAEELAERGYTVISPASGDAYYEADELSFKDVQMDRKAFRLKIPPISQLAKSFSARLEQVESLTKNQWVRPSTARKMLQNPDIEAENEIDTSDDQIILKNFHLMIKTGEAMTPLATDDLKRIVELSGKFVNWCRLRGVPSERWALITQYADEALRLGSMAAAPPAAAGPVAPAAGPMPAAPTTPDPMAMPPGPLPMGTA
jgi:hypothetical protein